MNRRSMLLLGALAPWPVRLLAQQEEAARPRHKVSAAALHEALSARFPLTLGIENVLAVQVSAPRLHLLPARNRLGAGLLAQASGPALRQPQSGEMDVSFRLRYEPSDQTLRAHEPELLDLRLPGLRADGVRALQDWLAVPARESIGEIVLHRFTARDLALADTMGFAPQTVTVVDDGLVVEFGPKRHG